MRPRYYTDAPYEYSPRSAPDDGPPFWLMVLVYLIIGLIIMAVGVANEFAFRETIARYCQRALSPAYVRVDSVAADPSNATMVRVTGAIVNRTSIPIQIPTGGVWFTDDQLTIYAVDRANFNGQPLILERYMPNFFDISVARVPGLTLHVDIRPLNPPTTSLGRWCIGEETRVPIPLDAP